MARHCLHTRQPSTPPYRQGARRRLIIACSAGIATALAVFCVSFSATASASDADVQLQDVMKGGQQPLSGLTVAVRGVSGTYSGDALRAVFENTTGRTITVHVPIGLRLLPGNVAVQTMVTAGDETISVPPGKSAVVVKGFCAEQHDGAPSDTETFSPGGFVDDHLQRVLQEINRRRAYNATGQQSVWHVTDRFDVSQYPEAQNLMEGADKHGNVPLSRSIGAGIAAGVVAGGAAVALGGGSLGGGGGGGSGDGATAGPPGDSSPSPPGTSQEPTSQVEVAPPSAQRPPAQPPPEEPPATEPPPEEQPQGTGGSSGGDADKGEGEKRSTPEEQKPLTGEDEQPTPPTTEGEQPTPPTAESERPTPPTTEGQKPTPPMTDSEQPTPPTTDNEKPTPPTTESERPTSPTTDSERPTPPTTGESSEAPGGQGEKQPPQPDAQAPPDAAKDAQFRAGLEQIKERIDKKHYVLNAWADDPTIIAHGLHIAVGWLKDTAYNPVSQALGGAPETGLTCEGFIEAGEADVKALVQQTYGSDATIERVYYEERSTREERGGVMNKLDRLNEDNHVLWRVTLPNGEQKGVEIWNALRGKQEVLLDWQKVDDYWKDHFGTEYCPPQTKQVK